MIIEQFRNTQKPFLYNFGCFYYQQSSITSKVLHREDKALRPLDIDSLKHINVRFGTKKLAGAALTIIFYIILKDVKNLSFDNLINKSLSFLSFLSFPVFPYRYIEADLNFWNH